MRSHLQSCALKLQTVKSHQAMADAMKNTTTAMVSKQTYIITTILYSKRKYIVCLSFGFLNETNVCMYTEYVTMFVFRFFPTKKKDENEQSGGCTSN